MINAQCGTEKRSLQDHNITRTEAGKRCRRAVQLWESGEVTRVVISLLTT